jgi:hypothetical protein
LARKARDKHLPLPRLLSSRFLRAKMRLDITSYYINRLRKKSVTFWRGFGERSFYGKYGMETGKRRDVSKRTHPFSLVKTYLLYQVLS